MDFQALTNALVTIANAMTAALEKADKQVEVSQKILEELKELNRRQSQV